MSLARTRRVWIGVPRELLVVGTLSCAVALFFALRLPPHGDAAAHMHRTQLVLKGYLLWDNLWYRGNYPLGSDASRGEIRLC